MERYGEYRNCPLSGIKEIPRHWEMHRIKWLLSERIEKSKDGLGEPLSMSQKLGVVPTKEMDIIPNMASSYIGAKKVQQGDLVFNKLKAHLGVFAVSNYDGLVSPDYAVYIPTERIHLPYLELLLRTQYYITEFRKKTTGVAIGLTRLYTDGLFGISAIYPPIAEQEKIVSYLESKTSKIDAYVADKEKEIQLLQELKQKTIAEAVTKGLNPNVKMKEYNSLISSQCPGHWKIMRNKSFLSLTGEKVGNHADKYTLLSLTTKGVIVRDLESGKGKFPKDFDTYQIVKKDDLVFCLFDIDETPRTVGLVDIEGMITGAYTVLKVNQSIALPEYVYRYYLCVDDIKALKPYYSGLRKTVRADKFLQLYLPLPPIAEQQAIVSYIEEKCQKIDTLITELQAEIDYLKEYKQRLIADVVTGQVNVAQSESKGNLFTLPSQSNVNEVNVQNEM